MSSRVRGAGRLPMRWWAGEGGQRRERTEVIAHNVMGEYWIFRISY